MFVTSGYPFYTHRAAEDSLFYPKSDVFVTVGLQSPYALRASGDKEVSIMRLGLSGLQFGFDEFRVNGNADTFYKRCDGPGNRA